MYIFMHINIDNDKQARQRDIEAKEMREEQKRQTLAILEEQQRQVCCIFVCCIVLQYVTILRNEEGAIIPDFGYF